MNKICCSTCEWTQSILKKNPPTYWPIGEMEGRVRETNIFLRVALWRKITKVKITNIGIPKETRRHDWGFQINIWNIWYIFTTYI